MKTNATKPRLESIRGAAEYLGVSTWTLRDYVAAGILRPISLPGGRLKSNGKDVAAASPSRTIRKLLFDIGDLDKLVEASR